MAKHSRLRKTVTLRLKYWSDSDQYCVTSISNSVEFNPGDWLYRHDVEEIITEPYWEVIVS